MKRETILYGVIGLLVGVLLMGVSARYAVNNDHQGMMRMMGMHSGAAIEMMDGGMSMDGMTTYLQGKRGDTFDEAFLLTMIGHHEGALDMAQLAKDNAKHDEIKQLADDIIRAQTDEIEMMKKWQQEWGYDTEDTLGVSHGEHHR